MKTQETTQTFTRAAFLDDLPRLEASIAHHHQRGEEEAEVNGEDSKQAVWHDTKAEAAMETYFKIEKLAAFAVNAQTHFLGYIELEAHQDKVLSESRGEVQVSNKRQATDYS
jgi:hypothetical protein